MIPHRSSIKRSFGSMPGQRDPSVELGAHYTHDVQRAYGGYRPFSDLLNPIQSPPEERQTGNDDFAGRTWMDHQRLGSLPRRYAGDGMDYRRPVTTASNAVDDGVHELDHRETEQARASYRGLVETVDLTGERSGEARTHAREDTRMDMANVLEPREAGDTMVNDVTSDTPARVHQRLPHFGHAIIDIPSDDENEESLFMPQQAQHRQRRPEYDPVPHHPRTALLRRPQLIRQATPASTMDSFDDDGVEVVRSNTVSRQATPVAMAFHGRTNVPAAIDLTAEDDEMPQFIEERPRLGVNNDRPAMFGSGVGHRNDDLVQHHPHPYLNRRMQGLPLAGYAAEILGMRPAREAATEFITAQHHHGIHRHRLPHTHVVPTGAYHTGRGLRMHMPMGMDYGAAGFDMRMGGRPPTPEYVSPAAPAEGFTRNPAENEIVVCPNCGDELALGKDEEKQQVWVLKACGHAYCGSCFANRTGKIKGKGKARITDDQPSLPFNKCVVEGCTFKRFVNSSWIHVYMSS